jgi:hypothetical protein
MAAKEKLGADQIERDEYWARDWAVLGWMVDWYY